MKINKRIRALAAIGLFAALVYAAQWLRFPFPAPAGAQIFISLGNILCLLAGFMLGPVKGGLAAGIGTMIFNFTFPGLFEHWPFQLTFRFLQAFTCGIIVYLPKQSLAPRFSWALKYVAAAAGQLVYVVLLTGQNFFWRGLIVMQLDATESWATTLATIIPAVPINAVVAVVAAVPLSVLLQKALKNIPAYQDMMGRR